jgi:hypothetical protein
MLAHWGVEYVVAWLCFSEALFYPFAAMNLTAARADQTFFVRVPVHIDGFDHVIALAIALTINIEVPVVSVFLRRPGCEFDLIDGHG